MSEITPQQIHQVLKSRFSAGELQSLCFELEIEYDDLPAVAREGKARELVSYMERLGRLADLISLIERHRPQVVWQAEPQIDEADIEQVPGDPPYKGMAFFDEADAHLFFGREALTAELLTRVNQHPFLAVVGASGSGKSSLVRAGLIPALKGVTLLDEAVVRPEGSQRWLYRVITPTDRPLEALAGCLSDSPKALRDNSDLMADDRRGLHFAARYLLKEQGADHLCFFVDQFEELFTLCRNLQERQAFIDNLLNAAMPDTGGLLTLILTLRADFYAHCAQYDELRQALETEQKYIGAMNREELRRAIREPAQQHGWDFEGGLVEMPLQDVGQEPGRLPLLSHALLETWHRRRGRTLTFAGYSAAGGLFGAIAQTAETVFNKLNRGQQVIARNIFLRLTELGEGSEDTRRRAHLQELVPQPEQAGEVATVLARLASARLITTSQDAVEVVHEALIREWDLLRRWLNEDRQGLQIQRRLTEAAAEWEHHDRHADYLYRGLPLEEAQQWAKMNPSSLNVLESDFLVQSQAARQRQQRQRYALVIGSMAFVIVIALIFAFSQNRNAAIQSDLAATSNAGATRASNAEGTAQAEATRALEAEGTAQAAATRANEEADRANANANSAATQEARAAESARLAQARLLAAQGKTEFEGDPLLGLALILEGWALVRNEAETVQATVLDQDSRQRVWQWGRLALLGQGVQQVLASLNESWLVVDYFDAPGELRLAEDGSLIATLAGVVAGVTFSPNESWLVMDYEDAPGELRLAEDGSLIATLAGEVAVHPSGDLAVTFSPNGTWLVVDYDDRSSQLWHADGVRLADLGVNVLASIFLPTQERLVIWYQDGTAYLLDLAWLEAMNGQVDRLSPLELVRLACDYPLANDLLDEPALQTYLDELDILAPQACQ